MADITDILLSEEALARVPALADKALDISGDEVEAAALLVCAAFHMLLRDHDAEPAADMLCALARSSVDGVAIAAEEFAAEARAEESAGRRAN